jgi:hypothetical protein
MPMYNNYFQKMSEYSSKSDDNNAVLDILPEINFVFFFTSVAKFGYMQV